MRNAWRERIALVLSGAVVIVCIAAVWRVQRVRVPTEGALRSDIRRLARELKRMRIRERVRAWATPGLAARQATWNAAKADHILCKTNPTDPKTKPTVAIRRQLQSVFDQLLVARAQSRLGCREMLEESGAKVRGYFSDIDCSLQPYSLHIPSAYDRAIEWPLLVSLHGHGWFRPFQGHPAPGHSGVFCVAPHGRGATDYKDLGEDDVLHAIESVLLDYNISRDRVYLTGSSMGGTGTWHLGVLYADRFAGLAPIVGNADFQAWTQRWGWNQPFEGRLDALRDWLQESQTARAYAVNLLHLPTYVIHGSADTVVPPEHSRSTVRELRALGAPVQYREFPGYGHGGFPKPAVEEALAWACSYPRERFPSRVRWRAAQLKHGKAYWVRLVQMDQPCSFAEIDARVVDSTHVEVETSNLRAFEIERVAALFDLSKPVFVTVDGERVIFPPDSGAERWLMLRRDAEHGWRDGAALAPWSGLRKRQGLEGPINEALMQPFVVVYGTMAENELVRALWYDQAWGMASEWKRRNGWYCPVLRDVDCIDSVGRDRNLILFGGPADNAVTARLASALPLRELMARAGRQLPEDRVDLFGAELLDVPDVGLLTVYPNPMFPDRLVVVVAAGGAPAIHQAWRRFGNWFNWGVFDSKKYFDFAVYDALTASPESFLLLGYYGADWSLADAVTFGPNVEVRGQLAPQRIPAYLSVPETGGDFYLSELFPFMVDQMRGAIGIGRTFHGQPLERSLGIRAPTVIEYRIAGHFRRLITGIQLLNDPHTRMCQARERDERVRFVVKGDGKPLASGVVSWSHPVGEIQADVTGVDMLRLEAQVAGGAGWLHNGAGWLVPCLLR